MHLEHQGLVRSEDWREISLRLGHATWEDIRQISFDISLMPLNIKNAMTQFWDERLVLQRSLPNITVRDSYTQMQSPVPFESLPEFIRRLENQGAKRVTIGRRSALTDTISWDTPSMFPQELNDEHIAVLTRKALDGQLDDFVFLNTN